jgi:hypothetical protein
MTVIWRDDVLPAGHFHIYGMTGSNAAWAYESLFPTAYSRFDLRDFQCLIPVTVKPLG